MHPGMQAHVDPRPEVTSPAAGVPAAVPEPSAGRGGLGGGSKRGVSAKPDPLFAPTAEPLIGGSAT